MEAPSYRFGPFEFDVRSGELRKHGVRIRLQPQSLLVLTMLLEQPGEAVLREEIQRRLWPNGTQVDFDLGINAALKRLRAALGDSADEPRYIEAVARRGYRFIGAVEPSAAPEGLIGKTVKHYRILAKLGSGGMGTVYRAQDTILGRQVALKFLNCPASEAAPEVLERFRREARAAAALNHPNICTVYGVEEVAGQPVIAMELLEGQTLADRLSDGPMSFSDALKLGIQLAHALDAGHRAGIVHRDFKPGNIILTANAAKILDFGLARIVSAGLPDVTKHGAVMGTPQYMAPEQIAGAEADARSDIYAFGAVLYEMVTGRKAIEALSPLRPPAFEKLVCSCLAKDLTARRQSLYEVAIDLRSMVGGPTASGNRPWTWFVPAALFLVTAALVFAFGWRKPPAPPSSPRVHFVIYPPGGAILPEPLTVFSMDISPDGTKLVALVVDGGQPPRLWVRALASMTDQILADTDNAQCPFWSPDSKSIGFFADGKLKVISASGGPSRTTADISVHHGGTWNGEGTILFSSGGPESGNLYWVPAEGGRPPTLLGNGAFPHFLPDAQRFLFLAITAERDKSGVYLGSLQSSARQLVIPGVTLNGFVPPDYVLFQKFQGSDLMAQKLDIATGRLLGTPVVVERGTVNAVASENNVLVYRTRPSVTIRRLAWHARDGQLLGGVSEPDFYNQVFLSPDEKRVAINKGARITDVSLWLLDLGTNVISRLIPPVSGVWYNDGDWSPDSKRLVFWSSASKKTTMMTLTVGERAPKLLYEDGNANYADDWSPDGKWILGRQAGKGAFILRADGSGKPKMLLETNHGLDQFHFSPDGQWLAYNSDESGRHEVYIAHFPEMNETRQVSIAGGCQPIWRRDGKELFYLTTDGSVMSVPVGSGSPLNLGPPKKLFSSNVPVKCIASQYAVASNGQKFLMIEPDRDPNARQPLHVVVNWTAGLPQ